MWPWGHLAAGYLCYSVYCRVVGDRSPRGVPALVVAFATQLPDLVDKPLAWTASLLPSGRSLSHSLVVFTPVFAVVWILAGRRDARPLAAALGIGYVTHLLTDALYPVLEGDFETPQFLLWPLVPQPDAGTSYGILTYFLRLGLTPELLFELALVVVASVVWHLDGNPGLATVRSLPRQVLATVRT